MSNEPGAAASKRLLQRTFERLPQPVAPHLIALNPTLELVAIAITEKQVEVFRFGGQRAFGVRAPRDRPNVAAICWKYDGMELGVFWSDNMFQPIQSSTGLVGSLTGFFGHRPPDSAVISCVSWEPKIVDPQLRKRVASTKHHSTEPVTPKAHRGSLNIGVNGGQDGPDPTVQELLSSDSSEHSPKAHVNNLPKLLAAFNVRQELPRLSALPHVAKHSLGGDVDFVAELFTRQETVDDIINHVGSGASDTMDLLAVVHNDYQVCLIQGSKRFGLCTLDVAEGIHREKNYKIVGLASHPSASCMAILTEAVSTDAAPTNTNTSFGVHFASFNVIHKAGHYLPLVLQATAHLVIIERYIAFSIAAVREAWSSAREIFSKYIENLDQTLSQKDSSDPTRTDIITAMYRMAVTGSYNSEIEEWLKDIMGLKGLERWSTVFPSGMVDAINIIHSNLLPAIDRCSLEAIRLRAICRNTENPICRLNERTLTQLLDDLDILRLLCNAALLYARQEIPQIESFVSFIQCHIQILKEPDSSSAKEAVETIASLPYNQLLAFISGPMTRSYLNVFFGREVDRIQNAPRRPKQQASRKIILSMLDRHRQTTMQPVTPVVEFINILYQSFFLSDTVRDLQTQSMELFSTGSWGAFQIPLAWHKISNAKDIRMIFKNPPFYDKNDNKIDIDYEDSMVTYIVAVPDLNRNQLYIHRKIHQPSLSMPDAAADAAEVLRELFVTHYIASFQECTVLDVKFAGDETLILLLIDEAKKSFIVQFPVFQFWDIRNIGSWQAGYHAEDRGATSSSNNNLPPHNFVNSDREYCDPAFRTLEIKLADLQQYVLHEFDAPSRSTDFVPRHLHVRGPGRMAKNLLVLDEANKSFRVFDVGEIEWLWR